MSYLMHLATRTGLKIMEPDAIPAMHREPEASPSPMEIEVVREIAPPSTRVMLDAPSRLPSTPSPMPAVPQPVAIAIPVSESVPARPREDVLRDPSFVATATSAPVRDVEPAEITIEFGAMPARESMMPRTRSAPAPSSDRAMPAARVADTAPATQMSISAAVPMPRAPTLRDVREWVAATPELPVQVTEPPLPQSPNVAKPVAPVVRDAPPARAPLERTQAAEANPEVVHHVDLSIGSVHVMVESPSAPPPLIAPRQTAAPLPREAQIGARLARRYVRR